MPTYTIVESKLLHDRAYTTMTPAARLVLIYFLEAWKASNRVAQLTFEGLGQEQVSIPFTPSSVPGIGEDGFRSGREQLVKHGFIQHVGRTPAGAYLYAFSDAWLNYAPTRKESAKLTGSAKAQRRLQEKTTRRETFAMAARRMTAPPEHAPENPPPRPRQTPVAPPRKTPVPPPENPADLSTVQYKDQRSNVNVRSKSRRTGKSEPESMAALIGRALSVDSPSAVAPPAQSRSDANRRLVHRIVELTRDKRSERLWWKYVHRMTKTEAGLDALLAVVDELERAWSHPEGWRADRPGAVMNARLRSECSALGVDLLPMAA